jgi:DNA processing protein
LPSSDRTVSCDLSSLSPSPSSSSSSSDPPPGGALDAGVLDPGEDAPARVAQLRAWLSLQLSLGFDPELALEFLRRTGGDPAAALALGGPGERPSQRQIDACVCTLRRCGARILPVVSPAYPPLLRELSDAAPLLFVSGRVESLSKTAVAIVGARAATVYGLSVARELGRELARAGVVVVSGLARGVDGAAHEGVLEVGGETVAVAACGPERIYPPEHRGLAGRICERGAIVTEFPPGTPPRARHFPLRNRLISGMCRITIVVEARERSGSLITVRHALDQSRDAMAVPGPIHAPTSWGPNRLIRDGAPPVLEVDDVLRELRWNPPAMRKHSGVSASDGAEAPPEMDGIAEEILEVLAREPLTRDELASRLGRSAEELSLHLLDLELADRAVEDRDGRLCLSPLGALSPRGARRGPLG